MEIIYWSDYACPFCYIGVNHLKAAIKKVDSVTPITITMKAFELDPVAAKESSQTMEEMFVNKFNISKEAAEDKINGINLMGRAIGLDFHFDEAKPTNTFDAHRITKLAQDRYPAMANALSELIYKAYFTERQNIGDADVLTKLAVEVGISAEDVQEVLESNLYEDAVRGEEALAAQYGIQAVPFFVVNDQVALPGALPVDEFTKVLQEMLEKEEAPKVPNNN
ncbi:MAG: DsbA family oxidoreductase [Veillonella sp.]|uniref:DsbA family oxidoreductase n=1 Tax=Veillonella sp. TaxID=1926307 RepID=UPI0025DF5234|nr:DsbA family oxidoreductase [Veillonella sp.]MBS4913310.1 DsbA family oxidoreductase [Veillonella sp.]